MAKSQFSILLVDDSEDDRLFLRRAVRRHPRLSIMEELFDGEAAISYISGAAPFQDRTQYPWPDLLLLDLKMPGKTGHEVLEWCQIAGTITFPIVVLSGSFLPADISRSLELGASACYQKQAPANQQDQMLTRLTQLMDDQAPGSA